MISDKDSAALKAALRAGGEEQRTRAQRARQRHETRLMSLPNVNGVGIDLDPATGSFLVIVYVARKVPVAQLRPQQVIPEILDGVPVRVMEIGPVTAQDNTR